MFNLLKMAAIAAVVDANFMFNDDLFSYDLTQLHVTCTNVAYCVTKTKSGATAQKALGGQLTAKLCVSS